MQIKEENMNQTTSILAEEYDSIKEAEKIIDLHEENLLDKIYPSLLRMHEILKNYQESDWDGRDALPLNDLSFLNAFKFLISLPEEASCPKPGICANGCVTLEWRKEDGRLFSLEFDEKGFINFIAYLEDGEKIWGLNQACLGYTKALREFIQKTQE